MTRKAPTSRQARFSSFLPAVLHEIGDYDCYAANISRTGVQLVGDLPVPVGKKVQVTLRSASGDLAMKVGARVVRVVGGEEPGEVVVGVEFLALDDRRAAVLEKLVARAKENRHPEAAPAKPREGGDTDNRADRVTRAQRADLEERAKLFLDDDPVVLEALARNPRLTKRELRTLVQRRELLASTIGMVAEHPRARGDEGLLALLAAHPSAALDEAKKIAAGLSSGGLRQLMRAPGLSEALRRWLLDNHPEIQGGSW